MLGRRTREVAENEVPELEEEEEEEVESCSHWAAAPGVSTAERSCGKGHRSSLLLETPEGGAICLVCFSNLVSDPSSPSHHVSYALSQVSRAAHCGGGAAFVRGLRARNGHLLVCPLVQALSSYDDEALARQVIDLVSDLCCSGSDDSGPSLARDFVARIADRLSSGALAWSRRQIYTLHCLGVLLNNHQIDNLTSCIRDTSVLVTNLVVGLQLPSEEIRGEILFVLYKLTLLQGMPWDEDTDYDFSSMGAELLRLSLETLLKTQTDDVRLNCIALLTVLVQKGYSNVFSSRHRSVGNMMHTESGNVTPLVNLFADAIKGSLLSSDIEVQIGTLDLIFHSLQSEMSSCKQIEVLNEECVTDYVFEILRLAGNTDSLIVSALRVLDLLATEEETFRARLVIGFPVLLSVLYYVAEIPHHPVQSHVLKLVQMCMANCPGIISMPQLEELALVLSKIFRKHNSGELGMHSETFVLACSTFVEVLSSPSSFQLPKIAFLIQGALRDAVLASLSARDSNSLLHSLHLLKETYQYSCNRSSSMNTTSNELASSVLGLCEAHLLPWLGGIIDEGEEEDTALGVLETCHFILTQGSDIYCRKFANILATSSWLSLSYGLLGLFPTDRMRLRVYLVLGSVIDGVLGQDSGQPIRDSYTYLPSDPLDLMSILGQNSMLDSSLNSTQISVILILYISSLLNERFADEMQILASLEQYILINSSNFSSGVAGSTLLTQLVHLYGFVRGVQSNWKPYSSEAEMLLFKLMSENDWDLLSMGIHPISLKWLFQQDKITTVLSNQILNFCRGYNTKENVLNTNASSIHVVDINIIAEMACSGDNCLAFLLVSLLKSSQEKSQDDDLISVIGVIKATINIFPEASSQFCIHEIDDAIQSLYFSNLPTLILTSCSLLIFNILYSVQTEGLFRGRAWLQILVKLLESLTAKLTDDTCTQEACLILGILSLVLHHSTSQVLTDASRAILLNLPLVSAVDIIVQTSCAKGAALTDHNAGTGFGELLVFVLLLYYFALKSLHAQLGESLDWQDFLQSPNGTQPFTVICIRCHDLCRLLHFGSSSVKLVASQCLLELLTIVSYHRNRTNDELRCSTKYLQSMIAVIEGLIFYKEYEVAKNCASCLSMILGWEKLGLQEKRTIENTKWSRLIMEELALFLASPGLASKSFTNQHKPATHVAVALLKLDQVPGWMKSIFNASCISGIVDKLSATNVSAEMVIFFRELFAQEFLDKEQVLSLQYLLQACQKHLYSKNFKESYTEKSEKLVSTPEETDKMCNLLIHLMQCSGTDCSRGQPKQTRLLEEIEIFIKESSGA